MENTIETKKRRELKGTKALVVTALGIIMAVFHMYTAGFGLLDAILQRSIHMALALSLIFLLYPAKRGKAGTKIPVYDYILSVLGAYAPTYIVLNYNELILRAGYVTPMDFIMGVILIVIIFEAARRVVGFTLPLICLTFFLYAYLGKYLPGYFGHRGFTIESIIRHMYLTTEGVFGVAIGVTASFIFLFIFFGAVLNGTGTGKVFIDISLSMFGKAIGGPAKAAVVASSLFGTINGSFSCKHNGDRYFYNTVDEKDRI